MVNRNLIREFDVSEEDWEAAVGVLAEDDAGWLDTDYVDVNQIVEGKIIRVEGDEFALIDIGYKSEGTMVPVNEWEDHEDLAPEAGNGIRVLIECCWRKSRVTTTTVGLILLLSKQQGREASANGDEGHCENIHEGDVVTGGVIRKIKGGLLDQYRRQRLPARQPGRHSPPARISANTSAKPSNA